MSNSEFPKKPSRSFFSRRLIFRGGGWKKDASSSLKNPEIIVKNEDTDDEGVHDTSEPRTKNLEMNQSPSTSEDEEDYHSFFDRASSSIMGSIRGSLRKIKCSLAPTPRQRPSPPSITEPTPEKKISTTSTANNSQDSGLGEDDSSDQELNRNLRSPTPGGASSGVLFPSSSLLRKSTSSSSEKKHVLIREPSRTNLPSYERKNSGGPQNHQHQRFNNINSNHNRIYRSSYHPVYRNPVALSNYRIQATSSQVPYREQKARPLQSREFYKYEVQVAKAKVVHAANYYHSHEKRGGHNAATDNSTSSVVRSVALQGYDIYASAKETVLFVVPNADKIMVAIIFDPSASTRNRLKAMTEAQISGLILTMYNILFHPWLRQNDIDKSPQQQASNIGGARRKTTITTNQSTTNKSSSPVRRPHHKKALPIVLFRVQSTMVEMVEAAGDEMAAGQKTRIGRLCQNNMRVCQSNSYSDLPKCLERTRDIYVDLWCTVLCIPFVKPGNPATVPLKPLKSILRPQSVLV